MLVSRFRFEPCGRDRIENLSDCIVDGVHHTVHLGEVVSDPSTVGQIPERPDPLGVVGVAGEVGFAGMELSRCQHDTLVRAYEMDFVVPVYADITGMAHHMLSFLYISL